MESTSQSDPHAIPAAAPSALICDVCGRPLGATVKGNRHHRCAERLRQTTPAVCPTCGDEFPNERAVKQHARFCPGRPES